MTSLSRFFSHIRAGRTTSSIHSASPPSPPSYQYAQFPRILLQLSQPTLHLLDRRTQQSPTPPIRTHENHHRQLRLRELEERARLARVLYLTEPYARFPRLRFFRETLIFRRKTLAGRQNGRREVEDSGLVDGFGEDAVVGGFVGYLGDGGGGHVC